MKLIKSILLVFTLSVFFAFSGVKAGATIGFAGIKIPALHGIYISEQQQKTRFSDDYQSVITTSMDQTTKGRIYGYYNHLGHTNWKPLIKNQDVYFDDDSEFKTAGMYRVEFQAVDYNILSYKYWGVWVYNPA